MQNYFNPVDPEKQWKNEYLVAKINADTVEIWPPKVRIYLTYWIHFVNRPLNHLFQSTL